MVWFLRMSMALFITLVATIVGASVMGCDAGPDSEWAPPVPDFALADVSMDDAPDLDDEEMGPCCEQRASLQPLEPPPLDFTSTLPASSVNGIGPRAGVADDRERPPELG